MNRRFGFAAAVRGPLAYAASREAAGRRASISPATAAGMSVIYYLRPCLCLGFINNFMTSVLPAASPDRGTTLTRSDKS